MNTYLDLSLFVLEDRPFINFPTEVLLDIKGSMSEILKSDDIPKVFMICVLETIEDIDNEIANRN